jgi:recombination protein RecR
LRQGLKQSLKHDPKHDVKHGSAQPIIATLGVRSDVTNDPANPPIGNKSPTLAYPESVSRLVTELGTLPGVGKRTAERIAFYILKSDKPAALALADAIRDVKERVKHCSICYNLTDADPCPICASPNRDHSIVLVVEQPKDLIALEQTGMFKGIYHVLMGRVSPLDGVTPDDLTVRELLARIDNPSKNAASEQVREVVLGMNPTLEGDGTGLYLADQLKQRNVRVTRLARGLPTGWQLEYANKAVLADAIQGRQSMNQEE